MAQWLRICLLMQGTRVRALFWEDPTCRRATRPVSHNYWACAWSLCSATREAAIVRGPRTAMKSGPHLPQLEKALTQKRRPNTAKNLKKKKKKYIYIYIYSLLWVIPADDWKYYPSYNFMTKHILSHLKKNPIDAVSKILLILSL